MQVKEKVTWQQLVERNPRLATILRVAGGIRDNDPAQPFCANDVWHDVLEPALDLQVGFERADDPVLGTSLAYDVARSRIFNALPDCRDCRDIR